MTKVINTIYKYILQEPEIQINQ